MIKQILMAGAVAIAAISGAANATPLTIQLQSGGQTYTSAGMSPATTFTQSIGNFTTTVNTGVTYSGPGLDLGSVDITSAGAGGVLVVTLSENGLSGPAGTNWLSALSGNFLTGTSTVVLRTYIDYANTMLGTGTLLSTLSSTPGTTFASSAVAGALSPIGLYALTEVLTITSAANSGVSIDAAVTNVPEPSTLFILASGLIGAGLIRRRRRSV